ncbi:MAG TPA: hypothetical protein VHL10_01825 [Nitrososphaera sp.]|nr:hypothetical protein [Nitrososphaera sp.]
MQREIISGLADAKAMQGNTAEVLYDRQEIIKAIQQFQAGTKKFWGACVDSTLPAFSVGKVKQGYLDAKKRGVKIMYITEITKDNLPHCMEITKFAELRHLGGVMGNFAISDTEYVAGVKRGDSLASLVRCNIKELVRQQRHVFDTLWKQAVPAKERIARI